MCGYFIVRRVRWTKQELEILGNHWTTGEALPKGSSLQELMQLLPGRSGPAIKTQCQNLTVKAKKRKCENLAVKAKKQKKLAK